jgi:hypothetical protein
LQFYGQNPVTGLLLPQHPSLERKPYKGRLLPGKHLSQCSFDTIVARSISQLAVFAVGSDLPWMLAWQMQGNVYMQAWPHRQECVHHTRRRIFGDRKQAYNHI